MIQLNKIKNKTTREAIRQQDAALRQKLGIKGPPVRARAPLRPSTDENGLNRTEAAWLLILQAKRYPVIRTQAITLKLADDTRYTPDFMTTDHNGKVTFWEVKGFFRDDAKVKIKVAARLYAEFHFVLVFKKGGGWITEAVKP